MLKVGQRAPEFTLPDHTGHDRNLTDYLHQGPLIRYFYPADFTPGRTKEACDLRDLQRDITSVGLQVVGVSPQSPSSHTLFRDKYRLPFALLSDEDKTVIKMYDVNGPLGIGVRRATYLLTQDRIIRDAVLADIAIGRHKAFVKNAIALRRQAADGAA